MIVFPVVVSHDDGKVDCDEGDSEEIPLSLRMTQLRRRLLVNHESGCFVCVTRELAFRA